VGALRQGCGEPQVLAYRKAHDQIFKAVLELRQRLPLGLVREPAASVVAALAGASAVIAAVRQMPATRRTMASQSLSIRNHV